MTFGSGGQRSIQLSYERAIGRRNKPSSVPRCRGEDHFSGSVVTDALEQPTRDSSRGGPPLVPYLALLRVGFTMPPLLPGARCALTAPFHPCLCPEGPSAVYSLLHFPSPRDARPLAVTVPCGARTFLER